MLVLSFLVLYGMAIFWTTLVGTDGGEGLLFDEEHPQMYAAFGTVARSMFSLFRMMNGDTDFAEEVFIVGYGRVVYVLFMITVGWVILAILTAVVSDNMIEASAQTEEEDRKAKEIEEDQLMVRRLKEVFHDNGIEKDGIVTEEQWNMIISNEEYCFKLCTATHSDTEELEEAFKDLSILRKGTSTSEERILQYEKFIEFMRDKDKPADQRVLLALLARMQHLEGQLDDL